jgi:hypothetical protein
MNRANGKFCPDEMKSATQAGAQDPADARRTRLVSTPRTNYLAAVPAARGAKK